MRSVIIYGDVPENFGQGFLLLQEDLQMEVKTDGYPVRMQKSDRLVLQMENDGAVLGWSKPVECFRGLSLLKEHWGEKLLLEQKAVFPVVGIMFDVSRNAVLRPETVRYFLRCMAMMGLNLGMLYTEDTYEVEEYPYFGHLRGRYTQDELRSIDDYAWALGIELCPCIQTLGHLNRALHWPQMAYLKDTEEVLMVGEESSYDFIRAMLEAATKPYRSNRIHIGMDEAHFLGQGQYMRKHGFRQPFDIMKEHLEKVGEITRRLGLDAMMWSDMYFRLFSPSGGYYDGPGPDEQIVNAAPKDVTLVYWDYYHQEEEDYDRMLQKHEQFSAPLAFAGGIWTWGGMAPDMERTLQTALPGLRQAQKHGIELVIGAAWGDNGAETNLQTALYGMQIYAEFNYTGDYDREECGSRFRAVTGADAEAFMDLTCFHQLPGVKNAAFRPVNAAKFLLYQDPLVPLFEADLEGVDMAVHYRALKEKYVKYRVQNPGFEEMLTFYVCLASALEVKCLFHQKAGICVRGKDRVMAAECEKLALLAAEEIERLRLCWCSYWDYTNRPQGFEVIDVRVGGVEARMRTAAEMMRQFSSGERETIESLQEVPLPYTRMSDGALFGSYAWGEIASACKVDL